MQALHEPRQWDLLKKQLKSYLPESLKVYGALFIVGQKNPFELEVLVDSWPDFNVVMIRPLPKEGRDTWDMYRNSYAYFILDPLKDSQCVIDTMDWGLSFEVQGLQPFFTHMLSTASIQKGGKVEQELIMTFQLEVEKDLINLSNKHTPQLSSLKMCHVELVDRTWAYGGLQESQQYISCCIQNLPSCCVLGDNGEPVSWVLLDQYCAIRMVHTLPEHRGKGYAKLVISTLVRMMEQLGFPVYCHVALDNEASQNLFKSLGFVETRCQLLWFHSFPASKHLDNTKKEILSMGRGKDTL